MLKQNCANHIDVNMGEIVNFLKGRRGQVSLTQYLHIFFSLLPVCATSRASRVRNMSAVFQNQFLKHLQTTRVLWTIFWNRLAFFNVLDLDTLTILKSFNSCRGTGEVENQGPTYVLSFGNPMHFFLSSDRASQCDNNTYVLHCINFPVVCN